MIAILRNWMLFIVLLWPATAPAETAPNRRITLDVVSWNIEWYPGGRRFARGPQMAAHAALVNRQFGTINPDIFLAQEMRDWNAFALLCDKVDGLRPITVSAFTNEESGAYWNQQLGIGTKLYATAAWSEAWRGGSEIMPRRGFNVAVLRLPERYDHLLVYNVHLKSNRSASDRETELNHRIREESVRQLIAHVREMRERVFKDRVAGVIVGGDFNSNHDGQFAGDRTIAMMEEAGFHNTWTGTAPEARRTWQGDERFNPTTFDYIFTKGLPETTAKLIPVAKGSSDHWPVKITLDL